MVWGDGPALFDMLIFIFNIYIYALEVLRCQGEVETPRVLFGAAVIVDLGLGMHKRGYLAQNHMPIQPQTLHRYVQHPRKYQAGKNSPEHVISCTAGWTVSQQLGCWEVHTGKCAAGSTLA